jgi:nucleoside-triphosphatase
MSMSESTHPPKLYIITGSRGAGKTSFCQAMAGAARSAGWQVAGIISNPVFEGSHRTQIVAEDLRSGQTRLLATRRETDQADQPLATRNWQFDPQAIAWGSAVLSTSLPSDLFIVDELGTLEFERDQGWQAGLLALDSQRYTLALVVVRPELLGEALMRWENAYIIEIDTPEDSQEKARQLSALLF